MRKLGDTAAASDRWEPAEVLVLWSSKEPRPPWHEGPILRLECGFLGTSSGDYARDRQSYISTGWNGVAGEADPIPFEVDSSRWEALSAALALELEPVQTYAQGAGRILVCLQHPGDQAAAGMNLGQIVRQCEAIADGRPVLQRQHPLIARRNGIRLPPLSRDLEDCALCVTWNSTAGVEAAIRGVPTVALHERSPAYEVSAHSLEDPFAELVVELEARERWAHRLAWQQWTHDELGDGTAWEFLKQCLAAR